MLSDDVRLELQVARRWFRDGNLSRAWFHLGLAKYYFLQQDKAVEHRVHLTLRLWAWLKNLIGLGLRK